jgi:hypothetical protein
MKRKRSVSKDVTVRLTIDFPTEQHTYLKMLAAKEGMSLRQFVIDHLPNLHKGPQKYQYVEQDEFDELLKDLLIEKADMLKRLSKK